MANTNRQTWILTTYGIRRINEAMASPSVERILINKIKVGDANGVYYTPVVGTDNDLRHAIVQGGSFLSFPITEKSVSGNVVTFKSFIPESSGGYDIREIGLYETVNGVDNCFALGTCEPIVKPAYSTEDDYGYAMSIDYKLNIDSVNLASVYDQIDLDPENEYVTKEMLEALSRTVLFVEGNLMDQISVNTHLLGLNRAQQLAELLDATQYAYANSALTSLYANLLNATSNEKIVGFWGFNYADKYDSSLAIKDFGPYGNNMNMNKPVTAFETGNFSLAPYIDFQSSDFFYLPYVTSALMQNEFTIVYTGQLNELGVAHTILAQSDDFSGLRNWSIKITADNGIEIGTYTNTYNYKIYSTAQDIVSNRPFVLVVTYKNKLINAYVNGLEISLNSEMEGNFTGLAQNHMDTTSYILDSTGQKGAMANAKICFLSLLNTALDDKVIRALSLNLMALTGKNIYRGE